MGLLPLPEPAPAPRRACPLALVQARRLCSPNLAVHASTLGRASFAPPPAPLPKPCPSCQPLQLSSPAMLGGVAFLCSAQPRVGWVWSTHDTPRISPSAFTLLAWTHLRLFAGDQRKQPRAQQDLETPGAAVLVEHRPQPQEGCGAGKGHHFSSVARSCSQGWFVPRQTMGPQVPVPQDRPGGSLG